MYVCMYVCKIKLSPRNIVLRPCIFSASYGIVRNGTNVAGDLKWLFKMLLLVKFNQVL